MCIRDRAAPDSLAEAMGWPVEALPAVLRGLGYTLSRKAKGDQPALWRKRAAARETTPTPVVRPNSPFAALAALRPEPAPPPAPKRAPRPVAETPQRRPRRRRPRRKPGATAS